MRRSITLLASACLTLSLTGCPKQADPPAAVAKEAVKEKTPETVEPAKPEVPRVEITGCYQWSEEGQEPHQLRITGKDGVLSGKYLGVEGPDFVAWFQAVPKDLKVEGASLSFSLGERDLWGDALGMDADLSGKESDGFSRNLWTYSGTLGPKGFTFTCEAEGADEFCTVESGVFQRVDAKLCGPTPEGF